MKSSFFSLVFFLFQILVLLVFLFLEEFLFLSEVLFYFERLVGIAPFSRLSNFCLPSFSFSFFYVYKKEIYKINAFPNNNFKISGEGNRLSKHCNPNLLEDQ
mgnify:CR=1 FL=1